MSNSDNSGCFGIVAIVIYAIAWIGTGTIAWNWVSPESFGGAIIFLIVWSILGYIAQLLGGLIIALIGSSQD
ncbi:hypothetical protein [Chryseobacterium sp.]|uniref:hypothetical protein n=1 Tax=Chryseobacterium sp. TaxID=1871047 RepID=UPI002FCB1EBB